MDASNPPKDKFFATYILFYALGTVTLIPSNFFTTATDYWMYKFRDPESSESYKSENRTALQTQFTSNYTIVFNVSNAVFIILTIIFIRKFSTLKRIIVTLCGTIAVFILTCIFVKVDTDSWQVGFMVLTLIAGSCLTGFCGAFLVTFVEVVAKFPPEYIAIIFTGQAICGILAAVVQIISLSVGQDSSTNGLLYFSTGLVFVALTLAGVILSIKKSEFFKYHFNKGIKVENITLNKETVITILQKIKYYLAAMFITAGSTVMVHPGVTSLVLSVDKGNGNQWNDVYFEPVITFLVYCTSDYIGRELSVRVKKPGNVIVLLTAVCVRLAFIPLLMFCNAQPRDHLAVVFNEDYAYIIFIIIFAFTNGYLMNLTVVFIATIPTEDEKPLAMFFIMVFMIIGMAACSFVSTGLIAAL